MAMSTTEHRERQRKGIKARNQAKEELIKRHEAEFDELVTRNRTALGLPPIATGPTREQLEVRIHKQEAKLARDRELLRTIS
jgi:hypothetical protein